ncbi:hypothetical protein BA768_12660 [Chryseobacterium sp. CBo1]|nr:hypothetical protein BA768_12660 [Chryseobacterium sp. CBo1]
MICKSQTNLIFQQNKLGNAAMNTTAISDGQFVAIADDFTLNQTSNVTKISIQGTQISNNLQSRSTGLMIYIYNDDNGKPNGNPSDLSVMPVAKIDISNTSPAYHLVQTSFQNYTYSVDVNQIISNLILQAGVKYWLVFIPKNNLQTLSVNNLQDTFFWWTGIHSGSYAMSISPTNLYGSGNGVITWFDATYDGVTFTIEGTNNLGINEEIFDSSGITISPNPAIDKVKILTEHKIKKILLYDKLGRTIKSNVINNILDVSHLQTGHYFIQITTEKGQTIKKIVKK